MAERYAVGDKIAHPKHGAGVIQEIVERDGMNGKSEFYVFRMPVGSMVVSIPVESAEAIGVRPVVDAPTADRLLADLQLPAEEQESNWSKRFKENLERIKCGDPFVVTDIVRSLSFRDRQKALSMGERKMLHSAVQMLASEIALAKDIPYAEADAQVKQILRIKR
ncbi:MAG: CarD family transcriptional regulator [Clostridia bacterium]|nr:CarD family transcriptional regulator [Clostridia bacterium]